MRAISTLLSPLAACATLAFASEAYATDCTTLPAPLYIAGSSAVKPLLAEIGKILVTQSPPRTIVYAGQGSCTGVDDVLNGTTVSGSGATALSYWDDMGTEQKCDIVTDGGGVVVDIGVSDVFASTCVKLSGGLPANVGDFLGPVQTMTFVVPKKSTQTSLSAEAAYFIYGFGAGSGVSPWIDPGFIFARDVNSGTERMIAAAIGVDVAKWKGTPTTSSGDIKTKVTSVAAADAEKTIGILAADVANDNRAIMSVLAYQHYGQSCGYYPDKDDTSNEKRNVRDGHYAIWGPLHLLTKLDGNGYPLNAAAGDVIGYIAGTKAPPLGLDLIQLEAQHHVVPQCAMRVKRTEEIGALASFAPQGACGCYYDKVANGSTSCAPCAKANDCSSDAPVCSYGYCETQ